MRLSSGLWITATFSKYTYILQKSHHLLLTNFQAIHNLDYMSTLRVAHPLHIELIVSYYSRQFNSNEQTPISIQYIINQFSQTIFGSYLLTMKEELDLLQLLTCSIAPIESANVLYRASEHNFDASKFHALCDGKAPTICIVQSCLGSVFGGFTSIKWSKTFQHHQDSKAFIFLIRCLNELQCPVIYKCINDKHAVYHNPYHGPSFGQYGFDIGLKHQGDRNKKNTSFSSNTFEYPKNIIIQPLCGGFKPINQWDTFTLFTAIEYEVIKLNCLQ